MLAWLTDPEVLIYVAGGSHVLGYLIINQVGLRITMLFGTILYIVYYMTVTDDPLWGAVYTSIAMGLANMIGLATLYAGRSHVAVPRAYRDLYPRFQHLPPGDFRALMRKGARQTTDTELSLGVEGAPVDNLTYIIAGSARVQKRGEHFTVPAGIFIGEVAYLLNRTSSATTILAAGSEIITWRKSDLDTACNRSPRFKLALEAAISLDMAAKVALAVAPTDMRQNSVQTFDTAERAP